MAATLRWYPSQNRSIGRSRPVGLVLMPFSIAADVVLEDMPRIVWETLLADVAHVARVVERPPAFRDLTHVGSLGAMRDLRPPGDTWTVRGAARC